MNNKVIAIITLLAFLLGMLLVIAAVADDQSPGKKCRIACKETAKLCVESCGGSETKWGECKVNCGLAQKKCKTSCPSE